MESVLRSLNQWEVVMGTYISPVCVVEKSPTAEEIQLGKAWELCKECTYTEIDWWVEDQECVSIRTNCDFVIAWNTLKAVYDRLANTWAALLVEIMHIWYDGAGILEHKSKMDVLHMKLTEARNPIPDSMYLNFFINSLPEEYDSLVSTVNYKLDTVEEVVSNL